MMDRNRIKERVAKLLGLAADQGAAEGEIENALRFAEKLMSEHSISQGELNESKVGTFDEAVGYTGGAHCSTWEGWLAQVICKALGSVQCYAMRGSAERRTAHGTLMFNADGSPDLNWYARFSFYGPVEDCRLAAETFEMMQKTISALAVLRYGGMYRGPGRSYAEGFCAGLEDTLKKQVEARPLEERALVVRNNALVQKQSRSWLEKKHGWKLRNRSGGGGKHHSDANSRGRSDGRSHGVTMGERRKQLN